MTQSSLPSGRWPDGDVPAGRPYLDTGHPYRFIAPAREVGEGVG